MVVPSFTECRILGPSFMRVLTQDTPTWVLPGLCLLSPEHGNLCSHILGSQNVSRVMLIQ